MTALHSTTITTTKTFEYDEFGRVAKETVESVESVEEAAAPGAISVYINSQGDPHEVVEELTRRLKAASRGGAYETRNG